MENGEWRLEIGDWRLVKDNVQVLQRSDHFKGTLSTLRFGEDHPQQAQLIEVAQAAGRAGLSQGLAQFIPKRRVLSVPLKWSKP